LGASSWRWTLWSVSGLIAAFFILGRVG
jgi:hypothetical protein